MADVITTTILVPNLHCSSCVSTIQAALSALSPPPLSSSVSIVSHSITIRHSLSLLAQTIRRALEAAGFDVYDVVRQESATMSNTGHATPYPDDFERAVNDWDGHRVPADQADAAKLQRHIERCEACRAASNTGGSPGYRLPIQRAEAHADDALEAINATSPSTPAQVLLSIQGMNCGSCAGKISQALDAKPWVRSVSVSLLTASASVTVEARSHLDDLVKTVAELGYEAEVEKVEDIDVSGKPGWNHIEDVWKATYSVGGMTCSSCVGSITRALEAQEWVKSADVNLVTNSAMVTFKGKDHLQDIARIIQDIGYDATLHHAVDISISTDKDLERRVSLRIEGLHCDQCPLRIQESLKALGDALVIEKLPRMTDPILRLRYQPSPPRLTLRRILDHVSKVDPAFRVSIHHELSLEERSRRMHARDQRHLAFRLALALAVAIPSFIIGIVYMSLVSSSNPSRMYLMEPMWAGSVSRAEWALFILATPVYFFAADRFHRRTIKELRALWRPGSTIPILRRFYRFGSMDMLMSFGTTIAYFASIAEIGIAASRSPVHGGMQKRFTYFDSVVFLTMFLLMGRLLEAYSKSKTGNAVATLGKLRPSEAILVESDSQSKRQGSDATLQSKGNDGNEKSSPMTESARTVSVDLLEVGDVIKVLQGGSPASDGIVVQGQTKFDESSMTGESKLITKVVGDEVYSGTINREGPILVQIKSSVGQSMLDKIIQAVREGQTNRAPIERVADVLTSYFVPVVTLVVIITWAIWLSLGLSGALPDDYLDVEVGGWTVWSLQFAIAAFVIACPCGIGLAAPTALFVGSGLAAQHGILAKGGGEAFQEASHLDCVVFDKTGTLTQGGTPAITDHEFLLDETDRRRVLGMARAVEENSSHPLAKAVVTFCASEDTDNISPTKVDEQAGRGMEGTFAPAPGSTEANTVRLLVGNENLLADHGVEIPQDAAFKLDQWKSETKSIILIAVKGLQEPATETDNFNSWQLAAMLAASDPIRPEAAQVIRAITRRGIEVWMISGDNAKTAQAVGDKVGIARERIIAGVLPDEKSKHVQYLQRSLVKEPSSIFQRRRNRKGRATVAMVGDGINDSPALTTADVGIAIGSGSDIAISSAKFVLISSKLTTLLTLIDLSRLVFRRVLFNFAWAVVYNVVALPIAAGVLYPVTTPKGEHVRLEPVWASLAMALSSLSVVASSLLLRSRLPGVGFRPGKRE